MWNEEEAHPFGGGHLEEVLEWVGPPNNVVREDMSSRLISNLDIDGDADGMVHGGDEREPRRKIRELHLRYSFHIVIGDPPH